MSGYATAVDLYRDAGWPGPIPLPRGKKFPPPPGFTGADGRWPTDEDFARWVREYADGNLAQRLPPDLIGIDIDLYKHPHARTALEQLLGCKLPSTWCSTSRDDGSGIYIYRVPKLPAGKRWKSAPVPGVEIVQYGHRFVVCWPSIHPEGRPYHWLDDAGEESDRVPGVDDFAELPAAAIEALVEDVHQPKPKATRADLTRSEGAPSKPVTDLLRRGIVATNGAVGCRHDAVRDVVLALQRSAEQGEPGVEGAMTALETAFVSAVGRDRPGGEAQASREFADMVAGARDLAAKTEAPDPQAAADGYRFTDVGNAERLIELLQGRARYVHAWGKWIVYRAGVWTLDEGDALITRRARAVGQRVFRMLPNAASTEEYKRILSWAGRSESGPGIAAMIRLARGAEGVLIEHEELDANPFLLNVRNGTVDLRTGELRPHDPGDLCTKQCPIDYDPNAQAPMWTTALTLWQPAQCMRDYLQIEAGAAATGVHTQTASIHHGDGGNGKSVFWGSVQWVLGEYACVPHKSLLVTQRHEQHETVKADLFRTRLALAAETKAADVLNDEQIKSITGGDRLRARRMREDPWFFWPTHTLVLFSNHRPRVEGRDHAIWRRLRLVPWNERILNPDPDFAEKLTAEAAGVLAWIVGGARRFLTEGFAPPALVAEATERYRQDEDVAGRFVAEVLDIGTGSVPSMDIKCALQTWCEEEGVPPVRMNEVAAVLNAAGCYSERQHVHGRKQTVWIGVSLPADCAVSGWLS